MFLSLTPLASYAMEDASLYLELEVKKAEEHDDHTSLLVQNTDKKTKPRKRKKSACWCSVKRVVSGAVYGLLLTNFISSNVTISQSVHISGTEETREALQYNNTLPENTEHCEFYYDNDCNCMLIENQTDCYTYCCSYLGIPKDKCRHGTPFEKNCYIAKVCDGKKIKTDPQLPLAIVSCVTSGILLVFKTVHDLTDLDIKSASA